MSQAPFMVPSMIKIIRSKLSITQRELGEIIGKTHVTISKWELGKWIPNDYYFSMIKRIYVSCSLMDSNDIEKIKSVSDKISLLAFILHIRDRNSFLYQKEGYTEIS